MIREDWAEGKLEDLLNYVQPTNYIVDSTVYNDTYKIPVLTAGKTFILGYTNEENNIFTELPVIIFDDFTTATKYVNFKFKVKSSAMKILVPASDKVNVKYVYYYMQTIRYNVDTHKRYWISIFSKLNTLIAPLPEQRAIVSKIEQLFSELDSGIDSLEKAKDQLEVYRQAVLKVAFEGKLTKKWREENNYSMVSYLNKLQKIKEEAIKDKLIPKSDYFPEFKGEDLTYNTPFNWITLPWKSIVSDNKYAMKRGPFGSALKKEFFVDKGIVVYEQGHAINNDPFRHRYYITNEKHKELEAFTVKGGDMIISCSGVTLGRICLLPEDADIGVINQALLKIDINEEIILKKFFLLLFRSETFQRLIFKKSQGTAMPNMVAMTELREIPIPVPSINEQEVIIKEIESRLSVCENIEANIEEALEKAEGLRQSILKKAFEGKLLSKEELEACKQEEDWEPAEDLLKRIKEANKEVN